MIAIWSSRRTSVNPVDRTLWRYPEGHKLPEVADVTGSLLNGGRRQPCQQEIELRHSLHHSRHGTFINQPAGGCNANEQAGIVGFRRHLPVRERREIGLHTGREERNYRAKLGRIGLRIESRVLIEDARETSGLRIVCPDRIGGASDLDGRGSLRRYAHRDDRVDLPIGYVKQGGGDPEEMWVVYIK